MQIRRPRAIFTNRTRRNVPIESGVALCGPDSMRCFVGVDRRATWDSMTQDMLDVRETSNSLVLFCCESATRVR